jgi:hypothetical protein
VNHGSQPSWERLLWTLIATVIVLELLVSILPHLIGSVVVLALVAVVVRLVWWYTQL